MYVRPQNFQQFDAVRYNLPKYNVDSKEQLCSMAIYPLRIHVLTKIMQSPCSQHFAVQLVILCNSDPVDVIFHISQNSSKLIWLTIASYDELYVGFEQGAKKIIFTACHSGKLKLAFTSPDIISTSPKNVLFLCYSNSS